MVVVYRVYVKSKHYVRRNTMYRYEQIDQKHIYKTRDLRNKSNDFHRETSEYFSCDYSSLIFDIKEAVMAYCLSIIDGNAGFREDVLKMRIETS